MPEPDPRRVVLNFSAPAFWLGGAAAGIQVFLLREFGVQFHGNELVYGLVLAAWLMWGGLGSLRASKREYSSGRLSALFFLALIGSPLSFILLRSSRWILGLLPGETIGLWPVLLFALAATFFVNYPLGKIFVAASREAGSVAGAYAWESLGAAFSGGLSYLILIRFLSNWKAAGALGAVFAVVVLFRDRNRRARTIPLAAAALALNASLIIADAPSQRIFWKPYSLIEAADSPYGNWQVIRTAEQLTFYDNGLKAYSHPDPFSAEEAVHFAMLQHPAARGVLLIGGGASGSLIEILKYPQARVDYVELDPLVIRLAERYQTGRAAAALHDFRVKLITGDARAYLEGTARGYDIIIADLPAPSSAQINRFYTREFYRAVRQRLSPSGVFSFRVPSAENYISPALQRFLASSFRTINGVFPNIGIVPGSSNVFLASAGPITLDPEILSRNLRKWGIVNVYVSPGQLRDRLEPVRVRTLRETVEAGGAGINTDLHPAGYFFASVLWSSQFGGPESRALEALAGWPARRLLDLPLFAIAAALLIAFRKARGSGTTAAPAFVLGLTTMAVEVMTIIWFQARFGFVYDQIAVLLAAFMFGLAAGAFAAVRRPDPASRRIIVLQGAIVLLLFGLDAAAAMHPLRLFPYLALTVLGGLAGAYFVDANALFTAGRARAGLGYGWDMIGSFFAAAVLSSLLIPLVGIPLILRSLGILNSLVLVFLIGLVPRLARFAGNRL
jgi:spermidine synthase